MTVKDTPDKRVAQGNLTRAALIDAARHLFGTQGYVDTSNDQIVAQAGLTKGALYHHFKGKEDLFRVVFEQVQHEVTDQAVAEFIQPDSWQALVRGCTPLDRRPPRVGQPPHRPARCRGRYSSWEVVREIENRFGTVALRGALRKAMSGRGSLSGGSLRPLSLLLLGALREGCLYIADAEELSAARDEVIELFTDILTTFRMPPETVSRRPARLGSDERDPRRRPLMGQLDGKVVLLSGGASGIGGATAERSGPRWRRRGHR